jgi:hypothetical protein
MDLPGKKIMYILTKMLEVMQSAFISVERGVRLVCLLLK